MNVLFHAFLFLTASASVEHRPPQPTEYYPELGTHEKYAGYVANLKRICRGDSAQFAAKLREFGVLRYKAKFAEALGYEDWQPRINHLCGHHLIALACAPSGSLFKSAQEAAFALGKAQEAKMLYAEHLRIITGYYRNDDGNTIVKALPAHATRIVEEARELTDRVKVHPAEYAGIVEEHLGVPRGLDVVIDFAVKKLLIRENHIQESLRKAAASVSQDVTLNYDLVLYSAALSKKLILVTHSLRQLLEIKQMADQPSKRVAIGELALLIVGHVFTVKLPDELLATLSPWRALSPCWFYCHAQLNSILMDVGRVSTSKKRLNDMLHPQIFYENITFASVVLALRGEAPEPYRTYLPYIISDLGSNPDVRANSALRSCIDKKTEVYMKLGGEDRLNKAKAKCFFDGLPSALAACASEVGSKACLPLDSAELSHLTSSKPIMPLDEDLFAETDQRKTLGTRPKKGSKRKAKKQSRSEASSGSRTSDGGTETAVQQALPVGPEVETEEKSTTEHRELIIVPQQTETESAEDSTDVSARAEEAALTLPQPPWTELLRPRALEDVFDEEEAQQYMAEFQNELSKYEEMRKMKQYEYDAFRDAAKTLTVAPAPENYRRAEHSVEFFATDDFLSLHPEASEVYHINMYNSLAVLGQHDHTIELQWVFAPHIRIGQDTFRFLCQVFGLSQGRDLLTFDAFLKAFGRLTEPDVDADEDEMRKGRKSANRSVFRFPHTFVIGGRVCLPPIVEIHREHESSGFNHKRVRAFLMHAGAHPYFFRVVRSKHMLESTEDP